MLPILGQVVGPRPYSYINRLCLGQSRAIRVKKYNECYIPVCDAKIVEPKKDSQELCKAGRFIKEQFFPYEPILKANSIKPNNTLIQFYQGAATSGNRPALIKSERKSRDRCTSSSPSILKKRRLYRKKHPGKIYFRF